MIVLRLMRGKDDARECIAEYEVTRVEVSRLDILIDEGRGLHKVAEHLTDWRTTKGKKPFDSIEFATNQ